MNDYDMESKILETIFEQLSVERRVRAFVTERMPSYIGQMQTNYKNVIKDYQQELQDIWTEFDLSADTSSFRFGSAEYQMALTSRHITQYEEMLAELEEVDQCTDRICCLVLPYLYGLGVEQIRRMIYLQYLVPKLKGEEKLRKKRNNQRIKHLKIISKSRKHPRYKPMPKLSMETNQLKH